MSFDFGTAQAMLTLAAIANAGIGLPLPGIKQKIISELATEHYATRSLWSLAWGPVVGAEEDNLVYVAQRIDRPTYAIVLRGTVMDDIHSIFEDIPRKQEIYPFSGEAETRVSASFLEAMLSMLTVADSSGETLGEFLDAAADSSPHLKLHVAGHSQGGAIAPMMLGWILQRAQSWRTKSIQSISCYASAPPSSGDPAFARWISAQGVSFQIINPLDTVPYWYGSIREILTYNVPERLGHSMPDEALRALMLGWADLADLAGAWAQASPEIRLGTVQLPDTIAYIKQAEYQHAHNSYLYLLGAPPVDCVPETFLPNYGPPHGSSEAGSTRPG